MIIYPNDAAPEAPSIQSVNFSDGHVVLTWTPPQSTCAPVHYRVISNCSTCNSDTTNLTTASCPIPQQWMDSVVCAFSVRSEICGGNLTRISRSPVRVTLQGSYANIRMRNNIICFHNNYYDKLFLENIILNIMPFCTLHIVKYTVSTCMILITL